MPMTESYMHQRKFATAPAFIFLQAEHKKDPSSGRVFFVAQPFLSIREAWIVGEIIRIIVVESIAKLGFEGFFVNLQTHP